MQKKGVWLALDNATREITAVVFGVIFSPRETSLANTLFTSFGLPAQAWIAEPRPLTELWGLTLPCLWAGPSLALVSIILFGVWTYVGWNVVVFLAGLGDIPQDLYEAAELSYDGPPETPEEFREMACAAAETLFSSTTGEGSTGYLLSVDASNFASWTFAFDGDIYDYGANQYTDDSPEAVEAATFIQGLINDSCAGTFTEDFGDQTAFGSGTNLFTFGSSSGLPFYASAVDEGAAFELSVAAMPHVLPEPVQNIYGASVSMTSRRPKANSPPGSSSSTTPAPRCRRAGPRRPVTSRCARASPQR